MTTKRLTLAEIETIAFEALQRVGASEAAARSMARATAITEAEGVASHGLAYIPTYAGHVRCGKVDGKAEPSLERARPGLLRVDAATGFAHPAIDLGLEALVPMARDHGLAAMAVYNSYNCGVLGYHTGRLARSGLLGLGFTNAPASIAPSGGSVPVFGTNPFSIAAPAPGGEVALLIDQSASAIAKSEVMKHAREGKAIPEGWALDADGKPTTDPNEALKGSMAPSGGYKGVGIGLMVELMAAAMTGANLGKDASAFSGNAGGPPRTGQFFIAIDPGASSHGAFDGAVSALLDAIRAQPGGRVPGDRRARLRSEAEQNGVQVAQGTLDAIAALD